MIALARQSHLHISFQHADICEWNFPRLYDFVLAWDSIWHIPPERQESVLRKICEGLAPGGVFMFTTGGVDKAEEKRDSCMGPPMVYSALGIAKTLELLTHSGCGCRHLEYDQYPEQHVYICRPETLEAWLAGRAGKAGKAGKALAIPVFFGRFNHLWLIYRRFMQLIQGRLLENIQGLRARDGDGGGLTWRVLGGDDAKKQWLVD
jgi:SAM-dependent methyltransferase